ncbi:MAG: MBL fold metallo-hydrolase [Chloroflexota bacterium]|nr:MAG: MBL fold metallo-hydrolase [Chloroflexota bacterium]
MQRERIADDIYVFTSDLYAQVTASVVLTAVGAVIIDTLVYPQETLQMKRFIEQRLGAEIAYVINTHFHADHTTGTCLFPGARVVSHALCRDLLDRRGRASLERAQASAEELRSVRLVLPDIVFDCGALTLHLGNKSLRLWHTPGHSPDSIVCLLKEDRVLFAADTVMPVPYFVDGSYDDFLASLEMLRAETLEMVIQGHGEVILRGEIEDKLSADIGYLRSLRAAVDRALVSPDPDAMLDAIRIEDCGISRILLNGAVEQLHRQNVRALASQRRELVCQPQL